MQVTIKCYQVGGRAESRELKTENRGEQRSRTVVKDRKPVKTLALRISILKFRLSAFGPVEHMRDGGGGGSAQRQGEGDARVFHLVLACQSAQLQR
ncbi:MAG: hypothetical protein FD147_1691 [Chloroflexi bacterium]|nr:MAG: hypothetical protein FD147_1691 [Chloroflexota bacterium]